MFNFIRWFQPASEVVPNPNEWHAFRENGVDALCGEARITYNLDHVADSAPDSGAHPGCLAAISGKPTVETTRRRKAK